MGPGEVLDFWFADGMKRRWFRSTPALDTEIRDRFEALWQRAVGGDLDGWAESGEGALALAIVLDQFPLNMYRGEAHAFSSLDLAIGVVKRAIAAGLDRDLPRERLAFLYMPLMHSETPADQEAAVRLFEAAGLEANARFARHHRDLVRRFGRFPHRNAPLGRDSTREELDYLASPEAFSG